MVKKSGGFYGSDKKMIKEGRGTGEGAVYESWLTIREVPSYRCCTEIARWKMGRVYHLPSKVETKYFYHLEKVDYIVDIFKVFIYFKYIVFKIKNNLERRFTDGKKETYFYGKGNKKNDKGR
jgi:hypothetical protein